MTHADIDDLLKECGLPANVLQARKHALDEEFERHPGHIAAVCEVLEAAKFDRDTCDLQLSRITARVRSEKTDQYEGKRGTVKVVDAETEQDPEVRKARRELLEHERRVGMLNGILKALEAKTSALKHLSELYQAGYYTTSSGSSRRRE